MVGRDQYGYIKGPYYMVKPGPKLPGEHIKVESKKLHKLGRFPKLHAVGKQFSLRSWVFDLVARQHVWLTDGAV